jgi:hypothetical protein
LLGATLVLAASPAPSHAASGDPRERGAGTHFLVGLGAGACTLLYTPVKLVYSLTAIPLSALVYTWSLGDAEMSKRVLLSGTQGDFVVTPEHLRGERRFNFVGSAEEGEKEGEVGGPTPTTASR